MFDRSIGLLALGRSQGLGCTRVSALNAGIHTIDRYRGASSK